MAVNRAVCVYDDSYSQRFKMVGVPYANQYYSLSMDKLETLRPCLRSLIERRWPDTVFASSGEATTAGRYVYVQSIKDARDCCVIVGSLYKDMKLRPSALEEYSEQVKLKQKVVAKYTSEDDRLCIEDQTFRMGIRGSVMNPQLLVTGLIVSMRGKINEQGEFEVEDYLLPGTPLYLTIPAPIEEKYIAMVSGAETDRNSLLLLKNFLLGNTPLGDLCSKITRLVVAGNAVGKCDVKSLVECDVYFSQLASSMDVDVMPGDSDPSNRNFPQQPIHPCFFEHSRRYKSFQSTTNPYFFAADGVRLLGTSGQAVKGICDYSTLSELEALKLTVMARCITPTAPDTLGCHPEARGFTLEKDEEFPHVIFSGNCSDFGACALGADGGPPVAICIPTFKTQPSIVLLSLSTLQARLIKLGNA
ncbi:DNA polymerase alpha subunit B family protein [Babesia divergens]|uniref:DNA polymerase alpha subunit B family protein n=1 Tax=Babesia divergens TaxID=32595 RepID=A0AAD9G7U5_BABDI|nr:DNA polymerase alpha subunit B family protein [Babesia divergens]